MNKIIFLDIDGVLNSFDNMHACHAVEYNHGPNSRDKHGQLFDERCVRWLNVLIKETGAKIVISSTWRHNGLPAMRNLWKDRNLPGEVFDITPDAVDAMDDSRGREIQMWLNQNEVDTYCIIDDDSDMLSEQMKCFVKLNSFIGLHREAVNEVKIILNIKDNEMGE